jgi:hypothetical protein
MRIDEDIDGWVVIGLESGLRHWRFSGPPNGFRRAVLTQSPTTKLAA